MSASRLYSLTSSRTRFCVGSGAGGRFGEKYLLSNEGIGKRFFDFPS